MNSPAASSLVLSPSPKSSDRIHIHDENLSYSDRSSGFSSPKGLRLALSPVLSPMDNSSNSLKWNGRQSFIENRRSAENRPRLFSSKKKKRRSSLLSVPKTDVEFSNMEKKVKYDSDVKVATSELPDESEKSEHDLMEKSKLFQSPMTVFDFDSNFRRVPWPNSTLLQEAYITAIEPPSDNISTRIDIPMSHQQKLRISGCSLLSFEDVIIPSIFANLQDSFRYLEGKAKGYKDSSAVSAFQYGRIALLKCLDRSLGAVWECRNMEAKAEEEQEAKRQQVRKQQREKERLEKKLKDEQLAKERETANTLLLLQHQAEVERRRREQKKNWPRNKELWNEVAILMTDLRRLEKEEKMWKEASEILDKLEAESKDRTQKLRSSADTQDETITADDNTILDQSFNIDPTLDHCAVSVSRITSMTESIESLVAEADSVRRLLYDSYNHHHKFRGYLGVKDPKALIRALAL